MKATISKIFLCFLTLTIYTSMIAQDTIPKKSSKKIIETGAGDKLQAKKIKQKQLHAPPQIIRQNDSVFKKKS